MAPNKYYGETDVKKKHFKEAKTPLDNITDNIYMENFTFLEGKLFKVPPLIPTSNSKGAIFIYSASSLLHAVPPSHASPFQL